MPGTIYRCNTMKSPITTHVLDTANGHPASGIQVKLEKQQDGGSWKELASGTTNEDGRITDWFNPGGKAEPGLYRVTFHVEAYLKAAGPEPLFYNEIPVIFRLTDPEAHYHIPLLLSPYGYTTYRGS